MLCLEPSEQSLVRAFAHRAAERREVWLVNSDQGFGRVASPRPGQGRRRVTLVWSQAAEIERWADLLAETPRIEAVPVDVFVTEVLPLLGAMGHAVGPDWSAEPIEPELEPGELDHDLRNALTASFATHARKAGAVWMLRDANGEMAVRIRPDLPAVPVWAHRAEARHLIAQSGRALAQNGVELVRVPLAEFLSNTLIAVATRRLHLAPGYLPGNAVHMPAWDVKALFGRPGETVLRVA
jgi:hypothetical protein